MSAFQKDKGAEDKAEPAELQRPLSGHDDDIKEKKRQQKLQQEWMYEMNKLKKRYNVIEKQLQSIYRDGNPLSLEFKDIFDWNQLMHAERLKLKKQVHAPLTDISNLVSKFEVLLNNITSTDKFLQQMTNIADGIEDKLLSFKTNQQQQLKELESAENTLWTELCTTTERLDTFTKDVVVSMPDDASSSAHQPKFAKKRRLNKTNRFGVDEQDSRPQKLIDVQRQIDEHGRYGGWTERDHADFLKLYTQIPSDKELLHRLSEVMPQYTLSELREHLEWFDHHERLWEYKRKLIAEWKQQKLRAKQRNTQIVGKRYTETDDQKDGEKQQQKQLELERKRKKRMVREWREQKEQEEHEEQRKKEEALKQKQLRQQRLHRERVREQKRLLLELQERRKLNELVKKSKQSNKNLKGIHDAERNKELLIKFRTKDMLLVSKKKEAICKKQQEERERESRMCHLIAKSQPEITVKEDKDRLLKLTTATKKRLELKRKEKEKGVQQRAASVPFDGVMGGNATRSVPAWRRGL
mmetsp:Transcript_69026/g.109634  ORF Transcript_69026/g.109634 Transcript_69026/m.109634 type:complete len:525 (-) Transcript_69026:144-1718(-)